MTDQHTTSVSESVTIWHKVALGSLLALIVAIVTAFFIMIGYSISSGGGNSEPVTHAPAKEQITDLAPLLEKLDAERATYQQTLANYRDKVTDLSEQLAAFQSEGSAFDPSIRSVRQAVESALSGLVAEYDLGEIEKIGEGGLYQVAVNGNPLYFTGDGKIMVEGDAFGTEDGFEYTQEFIEKNAAQISKAAKQPATVAPRQGDTPVKEEPLELINDEVGDAGAPDSQAGDKFPEDLTVLTGDIGAPVQVAVFTDPDCPFCRRFEEEAASFEGVEIANMLFPVEQIHPGATDISKKIWCAEDSQKAFKDYMRSGDKAALDGVDASCETPLASIATAASRVGVRGTPTFLSVDGRVLEGYEGKEAFMKWVHNK